MAARLSVTRALPLLAPVLLLAACDMPGSSGSGPGEVSEGEARALDEAAEMLEERSLPDGVLPQTGDGAAPPQAPAQESETE